MKNEGTTIESTLVPVTRFVVSNKRSGRNRFGSKTADLYVMHKGKELRIDLELFFGLHFQSKWPQIEETVPTEIQLEFYPSGTPKIRADYLRAWVSRVEASTETKRKPREQRLKAKVH